MTCCIQYHQKQLSMSSDVIIDTASCLPYRPSSRIRPVIISYRIPDDIATQSITYDIGYDDIPLPPPFLSPPNLIALLLPAPLPAEPCRPTGRLKARRHPTRYSSRPRLICLFALLHLICLVPSHRLIRPARCLLASSNARRRHSSHPSHQPCFISSAHRPHFIPTPIG